MRLKALIALIASISLFWIVAGGLALPDILLAVCRLKLAGAPESRIRKAVSMRQSLWNGRLFRWICTIMQIKVKMELPDYDKHAPVLIVMNHQNAFDVLVVGGFIPRTGRIDTRWVIKKEVLDIPIISLMARLSGCLPVARRKDAGDLERLQRLAREYEADGASFLIFVEGHRFTRPKEGSGYKHLLPPKHAGFEALIEALPAHGALDVTIAWQPPIPHSANTEFKKLILLYGRTLNLHGRLADPESIRVPGWLNRTWKRKEERLERLAAKPN